MVASLEDEEKSSPTDLKAIYRDYDSRKHDCCSYSVQKCIDILMEEDEMTLKMLVNTSSTTWLVLI